MDGGDNRSWMYSRVNERGQITEAFDKGVDRFIQFAWEHKTTSSATLQCPCKKCDCLKHFIPAKVKLHLLRFGFMSNYKCWTYHGEVRQENPPSAYYYGSSSQRDNCNQYEQMVMDAAGPMAGQNFETAFNVEVNDTTEDPNPEAERFYKMLQDAQRPLWDGCDHIKNCEHTALSACLSTLSLKTDQGMSESAYNQWLHFCGQLVPEDNNLPKDFYSAKKSVKELGLGCQKIHCCPNGCMLYYSEDSELTSCKFCGQSRYKTVKNKKKNTRHPVKKMWYFPLVPRLQRLYSSEQTAAQMRWHREHIRDNKHLTHPSDAEAWLHFDEANPDFAADPRNVRIGLCTDGFAPFAQTGRNYSCWPIIVTPYNLPPSMCMRREFLFLTALVPGPSNPKKKIDVYLRPLVDELKMLWAQGVLTYDVSLKRNFNMRAALMWTINDFPAYGMLSGWQTSGKLACPICMHRNVGNYLTHSRKVSWFDCHRRFLPRNHSYRKNRISFKKNSVERLNTSSRPLSGEEIWERVRDLPSVEHDGDFNDPDGYGHTHHWNKRSIFWELPYWKNQLLRHNLDVMHIERNVFVNILYTVMDTKDKTKDTANSRMDIEELCNRPALHLVRSANGRVYKPKAQYSLNKQQSLELLRWVKELRLPDGYASKLSRCVDLNQKKLFGMKSHDCHIFFQRLLPWAFKALPNPVLSIITEFAMYFRDICASKLSVEKLQMLEVSVPVLMCKLEMLFPPSFFDSMEHLPIHLAYEAKVGGPQQYRWMYPFERFLRTLKKKIGNATHVEGSIANAYLVEETSKFASYYYPPEFISRWRGVPRNDDGGDISQTSSIFTYAGRAVGRQVKTVLEVKDKKVAEWYVLNNCVEVSPYISFFSREVRLRNPSFTDIQIDELISSAFPTWFAETIAANPNAPRDVAWSLSAGADRYVTRLRKYIINGYRFTTVEASEGMSSHNYGVCVRGGQDDGQESDYYGKLLDIIQLEYKWDNKVTLFKCDWFDNGPRGVKVDKFGNVEVNQSRRYNVSYDPFILAQQAEQVYYTSYPGSQQGWVGVIKTKARNIIPKSDVPELIDIPEPFQTDMDDAVHNNIVDDESLVEHVPDPEMVPIQVDNLDDEEQEISSYDNESEEDDFETGEEDMEEVEEENSSE